MAGKSVSAYVDRYLEALGDDQAHETTVLEIASVLVRLEYEFAACALVVELGRNEWKSLESEEEILERAVDLTRAPSSESLRRVRERLHDPNSEEAGTTGEDQAPSHET